MQSIIRRVLFIVVVLLVAAGAGAETFAVTVRLASPPGEDPGLSEVLAAIEEGLMDSMFAHGHIVFDIELNEEFELERHLALDLASDGGARYLVLVDAKIDSGPNASHPVDATVTVVDLESRSEVTATPVSASEVPGWEEQPPVAVALEMGLLAAQSALRVIPEGDSEW